ncbi:hypothetical protein J2Y79_001348 [Bacillus velezensis]|nr:hypothetical protein [Bacillus velezensis]
MVLEKSFDIICAPAGEIIVTKISHALKRFFQIDHLTAQFFIFTRALFGGGEEGGCFENFHDHILSYEILQQDFTMGK